MVEFEDNCHCQFLSISRTNFRYYLAFENHISTFTCQSTNKILFYLFFDKKYVDVRMTNLNINEDV